MHKISITAFTCCFVFMALLVQKPINAQDTLNRQIHQAFTLGEVLITAYRDLDTFNVLTSKQMEDFNTMETSQALNLLPGVTLGNIGPRNESVVYVRGFDLRQVPVLDRKSVV